MLFFLTRHQRVILFRYTAVGLSGTLLDFGVLFALVEYGRVPVLTASVVSFILATLNNFLLNKRWTFQDSSKRLVKQYLKFSIVSVIGLLLNTLLLFLLVYVVNVWYILAKALASGVILFWNFSIHKFWTFAEYSIPRSNIAGVPTLDLSVIIPAFNEERIIEQSVREAHAFCSELKRSFEIIVVDDGSKDKTPDIIQRLAQEFPAVRTIAHPANKGKGASVRHGLLVARGRYVFFTDADGSTPIQTITSFLPYFSQGADIVIGSRYLPQSTISQKQPIIRRMIGRLGNAVIQFILLEGVRDTQCGFKAFTYEAARAIAEKLTITGWGFDMEALSIGKQMGFSLREVPVNWKNSTERPSRFRSLQDAQKTLRDLFIIKLNLMTKRYHSPGQ